VDNTGVEQENGKGEQVDEKLEDDPIVTEQTPVGAGR
jgi:hypothetical protein